MTFTKRKFSVWIATFLLAVAFALKMVEMFIGLSTTDLVIDIIEIVVIVFGGVYLYFGAYKRALAPYKMFFIAFLVLQISMTVKTYSVVNNYALWVVHVFAIAALTMLALGKDFGKIHSLIAAGIPFIWVITMFIVSLVVLGPSIHLLSLAVYFLIALLSLSIVFNKYVNKDNRYERKGVVGKN